MFWDCGIRVRAVRFGVRKLEFGVYHLGSKVKKVELIKVLDFVV